MNHTTKQPRNPVPVVRTPQCRGATSTVRPNRGRPGRGWARAGGGPGGGVGPGGAGPGPGVGPARRVRRAGPAARSADLAAEDGGGGAGGDGAGRAGGGGGDA